MAKSKAKRKLKFKMWLRGYWFTERLAKSLLLTDAAGAPELSAERDSNIGWDQVPVTVTISRMPSRRKVKP
jgi:hypothetical protein